MYAGVLNTSEIIREARHMTDALLGRFPTHIVVDSSIWDVSKWWDQGGHHHTWPPRRQIQRWCGHEVRALLAEVSAVFPRSRVAFRTAPVTAWQSPTKMNAGQDAPTIEVMTECIWNHTTRASPASPPRLYGAYDMIPYHELVDRLIAEECNNGQVRGACVGRVWGDGRHPGPKAMGLYTDALLQWIAHPDAALYPF